MSRIVIGILEARGESDSSQMTMREMRQWEPPLLVFLYIL